MGVATEGKSGVLAVILSLLIPGLGQFYVGQIGKGIMFLILSAFAWGCIFTIIGAVIGIPLVLVLPVWAAIDGYKAVNG